MSVSVNTKYGDCSLEYSDGMVGMRTESMLGVQNLRAVQLDVMGDSEPRENTAGVLLAAKPLIKVSASDENGTR